MTDSPSKGWSYGALTTVLILGVTLFRLLFCTHLELVGDEAYYWLCSRHLDLSFFDKGPGAATTIAVGTWLFGSTVFGVRFFAVILSMGTGIALYSLGKTLFSPKIGFHAVILALVIPIFSVGSILMTIDPISVFFWVTAALLFWKAIHQTSLWLWLGTGDLIGLGILAKYTNIAEIICFTLFLLLTPGQTRHLARPGFYLMLFFAFIFALPIFIWNAQHDWITVEHLLHRGAIDTHWQFKPEEIFSFLGQQAGVISPLIFLGILLAAFWPSLAKSSPVETRYLISLFLPLFLFYSLLSLNKAGQPNWTVPSYIAGIILLAAKWDEIKERLPWTKKLLWIALGIALIESIAMHETYWLHLPHGKDPLDRVRGSASIALRASELAKEQGTQFYLSNKYADAGLLSFYLPDHPDSYMPDSEHIGNQFSIWPSYSKRFKIGDSGLFVSDSDDIPNILKQQFTEIKRLAPFKVIYKERLIKNIYFFLCRDLHRAASQP